MTEDLKPEEENLAAADASAAPAGEVSSESQTNEENPAPEGNLTESTADTAGGQSGEDDVPEADPAAAPDSKMADLKAENAQLADQLARAQAEVYNVSNEYAGFVRRSKAEAPALKDAGKAQLLTALAPVFDDIYAARQHEELSGPFAAIVAKLETALKTNAEFEIYGAEGEEFDPQIHEALMAEDKSGIETSTVGQVLQPGYRMGERVLRPARVIVHNPA